MSKQVVELDDFSFDGDYSLNRIGIGNKISPERLLFLAVKYKFKHLLQNSAADTDVQFLSSEIMLDSPELFFKFPLSTILQPKAPNLKTEKTLSKLKMKFKNSEQKSEVLEELAELLLSLSKDQSLMSDAKLVADELMCNALFNAPAIKSIEEQKSPKLPTGSRSVKQAKLFVGCSEDLIVIGCEDSYGSLDVLKLLSRVSDCFKGSDGAGIANLGNQGAGLGTYMVFTMCSSMYFAVDKNLRTIVCCSLNRNQKMKRSSTFSKTLHLIVP